MDCTKDKHCYHVISTSSAFNTISKKSKCCWCGDINITRGKYIPHPDHGSHANLFILEMDDDAKTKDTS